MDNKKDIEPKDEIAKGIKEFDKNVSDVLVPILRDTIADYRVSSLKQNRLILALIGVVLVISLVAILTVSWQINKYNDFLSQFDYESTIYQDTDDNSIINSGINYNSKE